MTVTREDVLRFMRTQRYAVQTSISGSQAPQAAVVGIAVSDSLEIVFDTLGSSRKAANLRSNPRIAFVVGGLVEGDERTVQYEGIADEPSGDEGTRIREIYFKSFPDGRDRLSWPGIAHFRTNRSGLASAITTTTRHSSLNIAEGCGAASNIEFARFLGYSYRSLKEVVTALELCERLYPSLPPDRIQVLVDEGNQLSRMTYALMHKVNPGESSQ